jgi:hypothetical protein
MRWTLAVAILATGWCGQSFGQELDQNLKAEIEQAEQTLKTAGVGLDDSSLVKFFQERTLSPNEEGELKHLVLKLGDNSYLTRAKATAQLMKSGALATPFLQLGLKAQDQEIARRAELVLRQILEGKEADVISAAAFLLAQHKAAGAVEKLLDYLPFATDEEVIRRVREAVGKLSLQDGKVHPAVSAALHDKFAIRRAAAGAALAALPDQRKAVVALLKDSDYQVRLWVAQALLKARDAHAVPVLVALLEQLPEQDTWQAEDTLLRLAGETAPVSETNKTAGPASLRKSWDKWLQANAGDMDKLLKSFAESGAFLNYTLVSQMPKAGGAFNGQVLEIGPKNNVMWTIQNLRYPVDAQVIGAKRVLIAEYLKHQVVVLDFQGNQHWEYPIDQPIGCQLLANGNYFIAARRQLMEITRDKKTKFSYGTGATYIAAARKMPNGDVIMIDNVGKLTQLDGQGKAKGNPITVGRVYTLGGHIDVLPGNRVLIPEYTNHKVVEYALTGEVKWWVNVKWPTCAVRLPNGQTLVTSMIEESIRKFDQQGNEKWFYKATGRPWCARSR